MRVCMCTWNGVYGCLVVISQGVIAAVEECFTLRSKVQSTKNTNTSSFISDRSGGFSMLIEKSPFARAKKDLALGTV